MKHSANSLRQALITALRITLAVTLVGLIALESGQVVMRYVFLTGMAWGRDVITLMMFVIAWLGAPLLWLRAGHIALDVVPDSHFFRLFGHRTQNLIMAVAAPALAIVGFEAMQSFSFIDLPSLGTSAAIKFYPILAGAVLLFAAAVINLVAGPEEPDGVSADD